MSNRVRKRRRHDSSDSGDGESESEDILKPKRTGEVTRIFNPKQGSFLRIRKKTKVPLNISMAQGKESHDVNRTFLNIQQVNHTRVDQKTPKRMKKKSKIDADNCRDEGFNDVQQKAELVDVDSSIKSRRNTPSLTKAGGIDFTPKNMSKTQGGHSHKREPKRKSSLGYQSFEAGPETSNSTRTPQRWQPIDKRNRTPKAIQRGNAAVITPKNWKNTKTPSKFQKEAKGQSNSKRSNNSSDKHRTPGGPLNPLIKYSDTPEYFKVKEEDSIKQVRRDRKRRRNKIMSLKTKKGQPMMRGRIQLMLEKIQSEIKG